MCEVMTVTKSLCAWSTVATPHNNDPRWARMMCLGGGVTVSSRPLNLRQPSTSAIFTKIMATSAVLSSLENRSVRPAAPSDESPDLEICSTYANADGELEEPTKDSPHTLTDERKATVSIADKAKGL